VADEPPFDSFHELRWLRDQLEAKSANGAGPRVITVDQLLAFLQDLPDEPYFAPSCRTWKRTHPEVEHHERFGAVVGKECQCPCHGVHGRWWSDA